MRKILSVITCVAALGAAIGARAQAADSYVNLDKIASDVGFQQRVAYAMIAAAIAISTEAVSTPQHVGRIAFSKLVLAGNFNLPPKAVPPPRPPDSPAEATFVSGSPGFSVPDADIATAVSSVWNSLAGAF